VTLSRVDGGEVASGVTDDRGRVADLGPEQLDPGTYRLTFATGDYFASTDRETFYPRVSLEFTVTGADEHYHVPLLLSPFSYSTYRGN
jgi:5-hydroxyisourate hydrolase